jgi:glycolate oxidase
MVAAIFATVEAAHTAAMHVAGSTLGPLTLDLAAPAAARALAPELPDGWLLAVEVAGSETGVERSRRDLLAVARDGGCLGAFDLDAEAGERLYAGLRDFGFAEAADGAVQRSDVALLARAAVLPSQVARVCRLFEAEGEAVRVLARAGNGVVYGCWVESAPEQVHARIARLRAALRPLDGVLVVERCPPAAKRGLDVWGIEGPDVALMRRVKQAFDPAGVLSPDRGPGG